MTSVALRKNIQDAARLGLVEARPWRRAQALFRRLGGPSAEPGLKVPQSPFAHQALLRAPADLADRLCGMLKPAETPGGQVAFFGHSMGALLAFEVALRFEQAGNPIAALFVSASAAPGMWRQRVDMTESNDLQLLSMISDVTGANPEFLKDDQFAATLLPTLRGLKAITTYECPPDATVSCPIHALIAENDELATEDLMAPWVERTTATFDLTEFPGDHFYINTNLPQLSQWVEERIIPRRADT